MKTIKKILKRLGKLLLLSFTILIIVFGIGLLLPQPPLPVGQAYQTIIINNVSVVDVKNGINLPNRNVLIEGNLIKKITTKPVAITEKATIIDGSNRFLMPGLWDMHAHFIHQSPQLHFPLLISHGVTHVREMGFGSPPRIGAGVESSKSILMSLSDRDEWRKKISKQEMIGPYISTSAVYQVEEFGDIWDKEDEMPNFDTILQVFVKLQQDGVDFIKITLENNPPKAFFYNIMQAANQVGLEVVGHKPRRVSAIEASTLGLKSFEHARFLIYESSSLKETYLNGSLRGMGGQDAIYRTMIDSYDPMLAEDTFNVFKSNDTWYCPTHITRLWEASFDNEAYRADERLKYVPYLVRAIWKLDALILSKRTSSKVSKEFYELGLRITKQAHQAGISLLVGSDSPDSYSFHGSAMWDELSEFGKAEIPAKDILKMVTFDSARFSNQEQLFGSVEEDKRADLLLLAKNPLDNINNIGSLEGVIVHQQYFSQNDFTSLKNYVAKIATNWAFTSKQILLTMKAFF